MSDPILKWDDFARLIPSICGVTLDSSVTGRPEREDPNQRQIVEGPPSESQFVIAGPGSGKTTSATLRLLKLVYVDGVHPEAILATTFTRKAAAVLRSRIVDWGERIREALHLDHPALRDALDLLDLNSLSVGTIDSIAQDLLNDHKRAGDSRPSPVEEHVLSGLMLRRGVWGTPVDPRSTASNEHVRAYLRQYGAMHASTPAGRAKLLVTIRERLLNDRVDRHALRATYAADPRLAAGLDDVLAGIEAFETHLESEQIHDFPAITTLLLEALRSNRLDSAKDKLRHVLVDEYQDTNYLQETVYFELARAAIGNGGGITVVGDDDQSLFRFRGATVELFADFPNRLHASAGVTPKRIALDRNYRSTPEIVTHVNRFVNNDPEYAAARVAHKPPLRHGGNNVGAYPILGIFRDSPASVATAIARLVGRLAQGHSLAVTDQAGVNHEIRLDPTAGSPGDVAVLTYSVKEASDRNRETGDRGNTRFPGHLRTAFADTVPPIPIFNPRGLPLADIEPVQELLGHVVDCLDPSGSIRDTAFLHTTSQQAIAEWLDVARRARPHRDPDLAAFVDHWGRRAATRRVRRNATVSLNDIVFKLITWLPDFQSDIEHLAWLEAILRVVSSSGGTSGFGGNIVFVPNASTHSLSAASVKHVYEHILAPIAENGIKVSEDTLDTLPPNRVNVLTIHQSKGLEFPITIVDVGTGLGDLRSMQARSRFPTRADDVHRMEDDFRRASAIGLAGRSGKDRAFDDLVRNYFVAFSRAQDVLILVGHNHAVRPRPRRSDSPARHVASGWRRDETWAWEDMPFLVQLEDHQL